MLLLLAGLAAACGPNRFELYQRLPEADKELYDRSQQFMTERQQERFLHLPDSAARVRFVEQLHIADRLAEFPAFVQKAILAQRVVPGMSVRALLLSWGRPERIERRQWRQDEVECWFYQRGDSSGRVVEKRVFILRGVVTEVAP